MNRSHLHLGAVVAAGGLTLAGGASAHHSFAMFDQTRTRTLTATVTEFQWTNPHIWINVLEKTPKGVQTLGIEGPPTLMFFNKGLRRDMLAPGDKVSLVIYPLKNGQPGGELLSVTLPDGRTVINPATPAGKAEREAAAAASGKPEAGCNPSKC